MLTAFDTELWLHDGPAGWHFATLPADAAEAVRETVMPALSGFGAVRVRVTVGATTWATSLFPDARTGSYVLPVKRSVRVAEGLTAGDHIRVELSLGS